MGKHHRRNLTIATWLIVLMIGLFLGVSSTRPRLTQCTHSPLYLCTLLTACRALCVVQVLAAVMNLAVYHIAAWMKGLTHLAMWGALPASMLPELPVGLSGSGSSGGGGDSDSDSDSDGGGGGGGGGEYDQPVVWMGYLAFLSSHMTIILLAAGLTQWAPFACLSGLPKLKCYLNGTYVRGGTLARGSIQTATLPASPARVACTPRAHR